MSSLMAMSKRAPKAQATPSIMTEMKMRTPMTAAMIYTVRISKMAKSLIDLSRTRILLRLRFHLLLLRFVCRGRWHLVGGLCGQKSRIL